MADNNQVEGLTVEQKVVAYATATSATIEKAAAIFQEKAATDAKVAALIPGVVKVMVDNQRIEPQQAEKLAEVLRDPVKVLEILEKTAKHRNDAELADEQARLGKPGGGQPEKHAGAGGGRQAFVGQRSAAPAASDLAMLSALGIQPQQG